MTLILKICLTSAAIGLLTFLFTLAVHSDEKSTKVDHSGWYILFSPILFFSVIITFITFLMWVWEA